MSEISALEPAGFWKLFDLICSIPHPSGHERALGDKLQELAEAHGLKCRRDAIGNLRIDRQASAGMESRPRVILQGHLDMVPVALDKDFDFTVTAVSPRIDGEWVRANGTTLGADNGSGIALALALLFDETLECGPLAALFTVDEEVGMTGAKALQSGMLEGDMLINVDAGADNSFFIGCAGGARSEYTFNTVSETVSQKYGVRVELKGLAGGHSGSCIHEARGNAHIFMAEFLEQHPEIRISSFSGGDAENAIPSESTVVGATDADISELQAAASFFEMMLRSEFDAPADFHISVSACPLPQKVWQNGFQQDLISAFSLVPNGVIEFDDELGIVKTSSNFASVSTTEDKVVVRTSQRSLDDECRENITEVIKTHFAAFGASCSTGNVYPGWKPRKNSALLQAAEKAWYSLNGRELRIRALHAGLECGVFCKKNPALDLIAFGAWEKDVHTPNEALNIRSVEFYYQFMKKLLSTI